MATFHCPFMAIVRDLSLGSFNSGSMISFAIKTTEDFCQNIRWFTLNIFISKNKLAWNLIWNLRFRPNKTQTKHLNNLPGDFNNPIMQPSSIQIALQLSKQISRSTYCINHKLVNLRQLFVTRFYLNNVVLRISSTPGNGDQV